MVYIYRKLETMTTITIDAKDLKVNDIIIKSNIHLQVIEIESVSEKTITIRSRRVYPDLYDGRLFSRFSLNKQLKIRR